MFFHKKLGWLTPNIVTSPTDPCLTPSASSCSGGSPCLGSRTPPVYKVLRRAGLKPPAFPSGTSGPLACEGLLSSSVPKAVEMPIMLMSCSSQSSDFNPWNEKNIFANEQPTLSAFLSPLPPPEEPSPWVLQVQPDGIAPPCLTSFPLCHNSCGPLCIIPCAIQSTNMFPCGTGLPLAPNCASMVPCAMKIAAPGPCATKGANLCSKEPALASKCASPPPCTMMCPFAVKCANGMPCTLEILPASSCASPVSCATKGATEIQYDTKGASLTSPCDTKGANVFPCDVEGLPAPNFASPTSCATKGATAIPYDTKGTTLTSPCGTKCGGVYPCGVEILPAPNCASPVSCATKGVTTIPYATKGATAPCPCATKCVSTIPLLPQCACPVPCATKNAILVPSTPSWPTLTPCTQKSCCRAPTYTVPQVILKWAERCGISCPNIGTLSLSQTYTPPNEKFAKN